MQYLLLIYEDEKSAMNVTEAQAATVIDEYNAFTQSIIAGGHFKGGEALKPTSTAKTVRIRNGEAVTTDGPFAETREQLGGYYLIEAPDLETALGIARRIPSAKTGSIEVREIMTFS
jgi:hypothetical protein